MTYDETNKYWWTADVDSQHNNIFEVVDTITQNSGWRFDQFLLFAKYYLNRELRSLHPAALIGVDSSYAFNGAMTYNVVKMAVDAIVAKIAKQKPRVFFLTSEGNFDQQERAKNLTKYVDAVFEQNRLYLEGHKVFTDACIYGTGVFKVGFEGKKVIVERVRIQDVLVDEVEANDGKPEQIHQRYYMPRYKLCQLFPKFKDEIERAPKADLKELSLADRVEVIESWKKPSIEGAGDGLHCISIKSKTLLSEPYEHDFFPFAFIRWSEQLHGFYGESLVYEILDIQDALTKVLSVIIDGQSLMAVPRWFVQKGTGLNAGRDLEINDLIGSIVEYEGSPPVAGIATGASPELYQFTKELYERAFEVAGVSLLSATSKKPAGLESGKAMMVYSDIETDRFNLSGSAYQQLFLDVAELIVHVSKDLYGTNRRSKVQLRDKDKFYSQVFWNDIDLARDKFQLSKYSTSFLPKEPAGQIQTVVDMVKAGMIPPAESMALLDFPDTGHFYRKATAKLRIAEKIVNNILVHGKYLAPDHYMDLELLAQTAQEALLDAMVDESIDAENLELLRTFMDQVAELLQPPPPPMPPMPPDMGPMGPPPMGPPPMSPPGMPPMGPPGALAKPEPLPTSDLMSQLQ